MCRVNILNSLVDQVHCKPANKSLADNPQFQISLCDQSTSWTAQSTGYIADRDLGTCLPIAFNYVVYLIDILDRPVDQIHQPYTDWPDRPALNYLKSAVCPVDILANLVDQVHMDSTFPDSPLFHFFIKSPSIPSQIYTHTSLNIKFTSYIITPSKVSHCSSKWEIPVQQWPKHIKRVQNSNFIHHIIYSTFQLQDLNQITIRDINYPSKYVNQTSNESKHVYLPNQEETPQIA